MSSNGEEEVVFCEFISRPEGKPILKLILVIILIIILFFVIILISANTGVIWIVIKIICLIIFYVSIIYVIVWYKKRKILQGEGIVCEEEGQQIIINITRSEKPKTIVKPTTAAKRTKTTKISSQKEQYVEFFRSGGICFALSGIGIFCCLDAFTDKIDELTGGKIPEKFKNTGYFFNFLEKANIQFFSNYKYYWDLLKVRDLGLSLNLMSFIIKEFYYNEKDPSQELKQAFKSVTGKVCFEDINDVLLNSMKILKKEQDNAGKEIKRAMKFFPTLIQLSIAGDFECGDVNDSLELLINFLIKIYSIHEIWEIFTFSKRQGKFEDILFREVLSLEKGSEEKSLEESNIYKFLIGNEFKQFFEDYRKNLEEKIKEETQDSSFVIEDRYYYLFSFSLGSPEELKQLPKKVVERIQKDLYLQRAKVLIEEQDFLLKAFCVVTHGHYITFGLISKEESNLTIVRFDNLMKPNFIDKKTITNFTNDYIDKDFFIPLLQVYERYFFSILVYERKNTIPLEIRVNKKVDLSQFPKNGIKLGNINQRTILMQDIRIYFIVKRLSEVYKINEGIDSVKLFLSFILRLILLKTVLDRRVFMMVEVHMKSLKKILKKADVVRQTIITEPKLYSINKRIEELTKEVISTDNIRNLFEIDITQSLEKIPREGYKGPNELLSKAKDDDTLKKIKDFYEKIESSPSASKQDFENLCTLLSKIAEVMDEFSWSVTSFKIKNPDDFLRISLNYYQMLNLLNKINEFSEIFNLFKGDSNIDENKLKSLSSGLYSKAKKISETALECQPYNLYTLKTTGGFFHQIGLEKEYDMNQIPISDGIRGICQTIINNLNFSHYKLVSKHLLDSQKFIKSLESKQIDFNNMISKIITGISSKLLKDKGLVLSFFNSISEILKKDPQWSSKSLSCIIPVVDEQGNVLPNTQVGGGGIPKKRTLNSPGTSIDMANIKKLNEKISEITKKITEHKKLLEITFKNGKKFSVVLGDIKKVDYAQAVVNAANRSLIKGEGVTKAVFDAAGITENLKNYLQNQNKTIPEGFAVISDGFELKKSGVSFIIHAVGPDLRGKTFKDAISSLKNISYAVKNAIRIRELIDQEQDKSKINQQAVDNIDIIVTPLISGGIFSGDLGETGYEFIIMSNLAAIFDVLKSEVQQTQTKIPGEVILIEKDGQKEEAKIIKILKCVIRLCEALEDEISVIKY